MARPSVSLEKNGVAVVDHTIVVNLATGALVSGLLQANFGVALYNPSGVEVSGSVPVTLAELGASGNYRTTFTPNAEGEWFLELTHATHFPWGKRATYLAYASLLDAPSDATVVRLFHVADAAGADVLGLLNGDFAKALYDPTGAEVSGVVTVTVSEIGTGIYKAAFAPNADGKWLLELKHATYCATGRRWTCRYYAAPSWAGGISGVAAVDAHADGEVDVTWNVATLNAALTKVYAVDVRTTAGPGAWSEYARTTGTSLRVGGLADVSYDFRVRCLCSENGSSATGADTASATPTWASAVAAPSITSATDDGTGSSATLALVANDPANRLFVRYRRGDLLPWTTFATPRVGSGNLTVTGLALFRYEFQAHECGHTALTEEFSLPSASAFATVTAGGVADFTEIRDALYDWADAVLGITIVWRRANAPIPACPWASLLMKPTSMIARDHHLHTSTAPDDDELKGDREFLGEVEILGRISPTGDNEALSLAQRLVTSLQKRTVLDGLRAHGIFPQAPLPVRDLSAIGATEYEARAVVEFRFLVASVVTDVGVGHIQTVELPHGDTSP